MLEMIAAGVTAHWLYHKAAEVVHDENEISHVRVVSETTHTIKDPHNTQLMWQFECIKCKE